MWSVALYGCETWTLKKMDKQQILAFEMKCYRLALQISWHQKVTEIEVRNRLGAKRNVVHLIMINFPKMGFIYPNLSFSQKLRSKTIKHLVQSFIV